MGSDVRLILTTEADVETARRLAAELLDRRIVACVTMVPVHSMYRWSGQIESADEVQLLLKTTGSYVEQVHDAICRLHSYDVPEFLVLEADAAGAYSVWLDGALGGHDTVSP